jgi:hypothetical protein
MTVHTVLRASGQIQLDFDTSVGRSPQYEEFVGQAIQLAWNAIDEPRVKNALSEAGSYVGLKLPELPAPPDKPTIRTMVLGSGEEATPLLNALQRKHER